ncbi:MAG: hypothetical protein ACK5IP_23440, partial [Paracoccus sp. (in: a-proteobacteria)]
MARRDISFASFNLLNLQLPGRPVYTDADGWDAGTYQKKIDFTATMLRRLDTDVYGFQELWAPEALQQALDQSGLAAT